MTPNTKFKALQHDDFGTAVAVSNRLKLLEAHVDFVGSNLHRHHQTASDGNLVTPNQATIDVNSPSPRGQIPRHRLRLDLPAIPSPQPHDKHTILRVPHATKTVNAPPQLDAVNPLTNSQTLPCPRPILHHLLPVGHIQRGVSDGGVSRKRVHIHELAVGVHTTVSNTGAAKPAVPPSESPIWLHSEGTGSS